MGMASLSPPSSLSRVITWMSAGGHCFPREGRLAGEKRLEMALAFRFCIPGARVEMVY